MHIVQSVSCHVFRLPSPSGYRYTHDIGTGMDGNIFFALNKDIRENIRLEEERLSVHWATASLHHDFVLWGGAPRALACRGLHSFRW